MADKKKLTYADFPDEPFLNAGDLDSRQGALDAQTETPEPVVAPVAPEAPAETPAS